MDATARMNLVLAAVNAAGPANGDPNYEFAVADKAAQILALSSDNSSVAKLLDAMTEVKPFPASIIGIRKEAGSTRGVLTFKAFKSKKDKVNKDALTGTDLPPGHEQARTERTDAPMGTGLAKKLQSLIGYDALLWVGHETFEKAGDTLKMRVILHVEPMGLSTDADAKAAYAARQARPAA